MLELNNKNTESINCMCSKITIQTPKLPEIMSLLLTLNKFSGSLSTLILQVYLQF